MRNLILVKHAPPEVNPSLPPEQWPLSDKGRDAARALADALAPYRPADVVSSDEAKAAETGQIVARALSAPFETAPGLGEHDRGNVPHLPSAQFISMVELFFRKPGQLVL